MLGVNVNFNQTFQKVKGQVQDKYTNVFKPALKDGLKNAKDFSKDTVEFVRKNPKKIAKYGAAAAAVGLITAGVVHMVKLAKQNKILKQIAVHQRNTINDLKGEIADRQFLIDTLHETVQAAKK